MNENDSYIFGLLITDGNLRLTTRNRGRVSLEVNERDEDIIDKLVEYVPNSVKHERTRTTNFSNGKEVTTKIFNNHRKEFRDSLILHGFPTSDKTLSACPPTGKYSKYDFWRGVIDGDGSIGFITGGIPFVSLVTKSELLKEAYVLFLREELGIEKKINRNKRDNVFNITVKLESAVKLANLLYFNDSMGSIQPLYLDRKFNSAKQVILWKR